MALDPWIIDRLEEEERRRREDEDARRSRIELPQTRPASAPEKGAPTERVRIIDISPPDENSVSI